MSPFRSVRLSLKRSILLGVVAVALALLLPAPSASAQMMGGGKFMDPPVDSKEIDSLITLTGVDSATADSIRDLFKGFQAQFDEAKAKLQEIFKLAQEEAQKNQDMSVWQDAQKKAIEYYEHQLKLRDTLFDDIKLLLNEEQAAKWPAFERLSRRNHILDSGQNIIPGSSVDLLKLLDDTKADKSAAIAPEVSDVLTRYELELDHLLVETRDLQAEQLKEMTKIMEDGGNFMSNMADWERMFDASRALQVKLRETNTKYARQIAGMLPETQRAEFDAEFNRRADARVYAKTYIDQGFETALGLESLTAEQKEKVVALQAEYGREVGPLRAKWDEQLVAWQTNVKMMEMFSGQAGGNAEVKASETAKKELDERYYTRLREILTEEQVKALPDRSGSDWRSKGNTFDNP